MSFDHRPVAKADLAAYIDNLNRICLGLDQIDQIDIFDLPRGVWNANFRVRIADRQFVFKVYQPWTARQSMLTMNSGEREFKTLTLLEPTGIAPRPLFFDPLALHLVQPVLVYQYVPGFWIKYTDRTMVQAAEVYSRLHRLNPERAPFLPRRQEAPEVYLTDLAAKFADFAARDDAPSVKVDQFAEALDRLAGHCQTLPGWSYSPTLIHADPVPSNIIVGSKLTLIDWQTVMIGDPAFDLWAFTAPPFTLWDLAAGPTPSQQTLFRQTYHALRPEDPELAVRLTAKEPFYLFEYGLHCATRYQDFKSGRMPPAVVAGREKNFEKYERTAEICLNALDERA